MLAGKEKKRRGQAWVRSLHLLTCVQLCVGDIFTTFLVFQVIYESIYSICDGFVLLFDLANMCLELLIVLLSLIYFFLFESDFFCWGSGCAKVVLFLTWLLRSLVALRSNCSCFLNRNPSLRFFLSFCAMVASSTQTHLFPLTLLNPSFFLFCFFFKHTHATFITLHADVPFK